MSSEKRQKVEWGGLLRKLRTPEGDQGKTEAPAPAAPAPAALPAQRRAWASGAFLAAAARLVARGEESGYTLRRVVEWATAATGARRAVLWALETSPEGQQQLTILAWAAVDGWRPGEEVFHGAQLSPALQRAMQHPETISVDLDSPAEGRLDWLQLLGTGPIALCAAISSGEARGILAVAGNNAGASPTAPFGEDARAALAACAALAAIVFDRQKPTEQETAQPQTEATPVAPTAIEEEPRPFTALPDRAAMLAQLKMEIARAERFGHPLALVSLDLDRFGEWAQRAGAVAAANALDHVTALIRASIRDVDVLGRDDEDGFVVIFPVSEADDALRVGERIGQALRDNQPIEADPAYPLTVSGGAVGHPDDGVTADDLLASAERTATYAKRMGRDQIRIRGLGEMESPSMKNTDRLVAERASLAASAAPPLITQAFQGLIDALTTAGDAHDQARPGHGRAVGRYARALAEACGLDPEQARSVELAGMLHDAGKIGLPAEILAKRGPLTSEERAILREQPAVGKLILMQVPSLDSVIPLILQAHERYDGNGYPDGLHGNQILFGARIIAIAEGYEAMTNDRPYRRALSHSMAVAELWRESGGRYDPRLVDTFVRLVAVPETAALDEGWKPELLERVAIAGATPEQPSAAPTTPQRPATGSLSRGLLPSTLPPVAPSAAAAPPVVALTTALPDEVVAPAPIPVTPSPAAARVEEEVADEPVVTGETAWLTWSDIAQPPTQAEFWGGAGAPAPTAQVADTDEAEWEEPAEEEAIYYEEVVPATRLEINTGELTPPPARPRPTTGSLNIAHGLVPGLDEGDEATLWGDDAPQIMPQTASLSGDVEGEAPDQLSVDDTMLVMSQTALLRLNELQRITNRRANERNEKK